MEARDGKRLLRSQKQLANYRLLIVDELGFAPLSRTGAELLFEISSQRYERGATLVSSKLPFDEWTEVFGSERLTGALLDRLAHHAHILELNGDSIEEAQQLLDDVAAGRNPATTRADKLKSEARLRSGGRVSVWAYGREKRPRQRPNTAASWSATSCPRLAAVGSTR
jgi:hypothetical protein